MKNKYQILGLEEGCTFDKVKSAYRTLSRKYHPDINGTSDENIKRFYEINDAYNSIKKDLKKICKLLKIDENEPLEEVEIEYKKQVEELEFRVKMGNPEAEDQLDELRKSFTFFAAAYKNDQTNW